MFRLAFLTLWALSSLSGTATAQNILFILDASGSMWAKLEDRAKMDTAKSALSEIIGTLPDTSKGGLMVYGHRYERDAPNACSDIEMLTTVGQKSTAELQNQINQIVPKGKTPIAGALGMAPDAFIGMESSNNNIVLVTDGIETCDGDPCTVAGKLAASNINVRVHVVGFDLSDKDRRQLECIADRGNGKYFAANSVQGLNTAVGEAVRIAQAETAPAPAPGPKLYFEDQFDGSALSEYWTVNNPNPDAYLVEDGKLLLFSSQQSGFADVEMQNLVTLSHKLPTGDWDAVVRFSGELSSGRDRLWIGFRKDENSFLSATLTNKFNVADDYHGDQVWLGLAKRASGQDTKAPSISVFSGTTDVQYEEFMKNIKEDSAVVTLSKRGRSYSASMVVSGINDDTGKPVKWKTDKLTSLRPPGPLTIGVDLYEKRPGEILVFIDSVEIFSVK